MMEASMEATEAQGNAPAISAEEEAELRRWVKEHPPRLAELTEARKTVAVCLEAVAINGAVLRHVPERLRTRDLCEVAVHNHPSAIFGVPETVLDEPLVVKAVSAHGKLLRHLPEQLRTEQVCIAAVEAGGEIDFVPAALRTEAIALALVRSGCSLMHALTAPRTEAVCRAAVARDGSELGHVPQSLRSPALCVLAVKTKPDAIRHWPAVYRRSEPHLVAAVEANPEVLRCLEKHEKTWEVCRAAVRRCGTLFAAVPVELRDDDVWEAAVSATSHPCSVEHLPPEARTPQVLHAALHRDPRQLRDVPHPELTPEMCAIAVEAGGDQIWRLVPEDIRDATVAFIRTMPSAGPEGPAP